MNFEERIAALKSTVEASNTVRQFEWRKAIFDRIKKYIKDSRGDNEKFYENIWIDYPCWVAWYFDTDRGFPMYVTQKQAEMKEKFYAYEECWFMMQRRAGKTAGIAALILYHSMRYANEETIIFAPTEDQLVIMKEIRGFMGRKSAVDLFNKFLGENVNKNSIAAGADKLGVSFNKESIRFKNGSSIEAHNLNIKQKSDTKRGFSATVIVVDESALVPADTMNSIVEPILMDAHNANVKKRLVKLCTPTEAYDDDLRRKWAEALVDNTIGTIWSNCWSAIEDGIRLPNVMRKRFVKLKIPCEYVLRAGVCPVYLPSIYKELTNLDPPKDANGKVFEHCPCGSRSSKDYVQEDLAEFAESNLIGISAQWLEQSAGDHHFSMPEMLPKDRVYIMAIDWGDIYADTDIGIWEVVQENCMGLNMLSIKLVYNEVIKDSHVVGEKNPSADRVKYLHSVVPIYKIYVDTTGKKEQVAELVRGDKNIPKIVIYTPENVEKKGAVGMWFNGPLKAEVMNYMVDCLKTGRVIVPKKEVGFFKKYEGQLLGLRPEAPTATRNYVLWPDTLHLTDMVAMACWHLYQEAQDGDFSYNEIVPVRMPGSDDDDN